MENGKVTVSKLSNQTEGNAEVGDILKGKTAWVNGAKITGTMEDRGIVNQTLKAGESYTIQPGYYGGGSINVEELKNNKKVIEIKKGLNSKTAQTISVKGIEGYETFSVNNFFIVGDKFGWEWNSSVVDVQTMTRSYDSNNGVLTLGPLTVKFNAAMAEHGYGAGWLLYDVYYIE